MPSRRSLRGGPPASGRTQSVSPSVTNETWPVKIDVACAVVAAINTAADRNAKVLVRQAKAEMAQARPMMQAVTINSSSSASDTLPGTEYGFNSGFSAYLSKMEALILDMLTCPMVQPPKRRSVISS